MLATSLPHIPAHDADPKAFYVSDQAQRDAAVLWARDVALHPADHSDHDLIRACRVLIVNSNPDFRFATELIRVMRQENEA